MSDFSEHSSDNFWHDLITWSNKEKYNPTRKWNLFQRWLLHEDKIKNDFIIAKKELRKNYKVIKDSEKDEIKDVIERYNNIHDDEMDFISFNDVAVVDYFVLAIFFLPAVFTKSTLSGYGMFNEAKFYSVADFEGATFDCKAIFDGVTFHLSATFDRVSLSSYASFKNCIFHEKASFREAKFKECANFQKVTFMSTAIFENIQNGASLDFTRARFIYSPPSTFGTTLHHNSSFLHVSWPKPNRITVEHHFKIYERLRIQVQNLGMIESRNIFLRKELECRAAIAKGTDKLLRNAYGFISNHGTSSGRPLLCLLSLFFISYHFWGMYFFQFPIKYPEVNHFDLFLFNLSKTIPIINLDTLYTNKHINETLGAAPFYLKIPSVLLSVTSPILLFLAGLGLRSKFRMLP